MSYLDRIDRVFRPLAIPNLTNILVFGQAAMFLLTMTDPRLADRASLVFSEVLGGEVWRLLTFAFIPPAPGMFWIFALFYFWIFYMIGNAIEQTWGQVRYTAYLLVGILLTILAAAANPDVAVTGLFLYSTVFYAFATLNPNYEFLILFVLPVKVKYLAALGIGFSVLSIVFTPGLGRLIPMAAIANYVLFFAPDLIAAMRTSRRRMKHQVRTKQLAGESAKPRNLCALCGIDSRTHPKMQFRYCSKCSGEKAYCETHLSNHDHV